MARNGPVYVDVGKVRSKIRGSRREVGACPERHGCGNGVDREEEDQAKEKKANAGIGY
jgi:hypothetical protein